VGFEKPPERATLAAFAAAVALFFANDVAFLAARTTTQVYLADYAFKLATLALIAAVPALRAAAFAPERSPLQIGVVLVVLGVAAVGYIVARTVEPAIGGLLPATRLFRFPSIADPALRWFDLSIGIALTAIVEELVFRKLFLSLLVPHWRLGSVLIVSSTLFGLIHWSGGIGLVVSAGLTGAVFALAAIRMKSFVAVMAAHYLVDLALFAQN
jgi:membrane protease YdiL (CAAX protease family)